MFFDKFQNFIFHNRHLTIVILLSLVLNFIFIYWGADLVLTHDKYIGGDTSGWVLSFLNLINSGEYTFNLNNPDAYFGRVPGFSFFWGGHYILFGEEYAYQAVAVSHAFLTAVGVYFVYSITHNIYNDKRVCLLAAALYACYPFSIYWITISYAETLSVFLNLCFFYILVRNNKKTPHYLLLGVLAAIAFLTREFMGSVLIIALLYVYLDNSITNVKLKSIYTFLIFIGFISIYSIWPIRNYVNHNKIILGRSYNGFELYNDHLLSYTDWVHCWDSDDDMWLKNAIAAPEDIVFPENAFLSKIENEKASLLIKKANECGTSFLHWQTAKSKPVVPVENCNLEIETGFSQLRENFIRQHPVRYLFDVPLKNLSKSIFKNSLNAGSMIDNRSVLAISVLFAARTLLVLLGIVGLVISRKVFKTKAILLLFVWIYFYICFIYRYVEMRNFIQTDVLLLIPAAYSIIIFFDWFKRINYKLNVKSDKR